jgi:hypothetical protein
MDPGNGWTQSMWNAGFRVLKAIYAQGVPLSSTLSLYFPDTKPEPNSIVVPRDYNLIASALFSSSPEKTGH